MTIDQYRDKAPIYLGLMAKAVLELRNEGNVDPSDEDVDERLQDIAAKIEATMTREQLEALSAAMEAEGPAIEVMMADINRNAPPPWRAILATPAPSPPGTPTPLVRPGGRSTQRSNVVAPASSAGVVIAIFAVGALVAIGLIAMT